METPCPKCGQAALPSSEEETRSFANIEVIAPSRTLVCGSCGHAFTSPNRDRAIDLDVARKLSEMGARNKEAFRFMRRALGYTAAELGELLGVEPETLSRWETGKRAIPSCQMTNLASLVLDRQRGRDSMVARLRAVVENTRGGPDAPLHVTRV